MELSSSSSVNIKAIDKVGSESIEVLAIQVLDISNFSILNEGVEAELRDLLDNLSVSLTIKLLLQLLVRLNDGLLEPIKLLIFGGSDVSDGLSLDLREGLN